MLKCIVSVIAGTIRASEIFFRLSLDFLGLYGLVLIGIGLCKIQTNEGYNTILYGMTLFSALAAQQLSWLFTLCVITGFYKISKLMKSLFFKN